MKLLPYPAGEPSDREIRFKGKDLLEANERELREVRGNDIAMIFQEPMTSLNPLHTIERQVGEILTVHRGISGPAARARDAGAARTGRHPRPREPARRLSASALGRSAPARDDRHGARQRAGTAHRRRADDRARRHRAGADPEAPRASCKARHGDGDAVHYPRPRHRAQDGGRRLRDDRGGGSSSRARPRRCSQRRSTPIRGIFSPPSRRALQPNPGPARRSSSRPRT